jgi:hypothetical protein
MILFVFVVVVPYLVLGALYMKFRKGATSASEMVPHGDFWFALPGLIKEGFRFTLTKGRCIGTNGQYQAI